MKEKLNQIKEDFKSNPLHFLRENLSLIIGIPALLGGFWQVIELSKLSFSYLRFFSISQIVPDGLLIIIVSIIILIVIYTFAIIFKADEENNQYNLQKHIEEKPPLSNYIIYFLDFIFFVIIMINLNLIYDFPNGSIIFIIMKIICTAILSAIAFSISEYAISRSNDELKTKSSGLRGFIIIPFIYTCYSLLIDFHEMYIFPKELLNINNINCYIKSTNNENVKIEIKYLNDKYIFLDVSEYKLTSNKDTLFYLPKYQIVSFETILNQAPCITIKKNEQKIQDSLEQRNKNIDLKMKKIINKLDSLNNTKSKSLK